MKTFMTKRLLLGVLTVTCLVSGLGMSQAEAGHRFRQRPVRNRAPVVSYYQTQPVRVMTTEKPGTTHVGHHTILPTDLKPTQYHPDQRLN